jgi:hypothetical protein
MEILYQPRRVLWYLWLKCIGNRNGFSFNRWWTGILGIKRCSEGKHMEIFPREVEFDGGIIGEWKAKVKIKHKKTG